MKKQVIALLTLLAMVATMVPAAAAPAYVMPEAAVDEPTITTITFDDMATNAIPFGVLGTNLSSQVRQLDPDVKDKAIQVKKQSAIAYLDVGMRESASNMGFVTDFMFDEAEVAKKFQAVDVTGTYTTAFTIETDGAVVLPSGKKVTTLKPNRWYTIGLLYRFGAGRYDIYINDKCIAENQIISGIVNDSNWRITTLDEVKKFRFWIDGGGFESSVYIDNIHGFKGKKYLGNKGLPRTYNPEVTEEIIEEEADVNSTSIDQNADFDNEPLGEQPATMYQLMSVGESAPGNYCKIELDPDDPTNHVMNMYKAEGHTAATAIDFSIDCSALHWANMEFRFKENNQGAYAKHQILFRSDNPSWNNIITFDTAGVLIVGDKVRVEYDPNVWHDFRMVLNMRELRYEVVELDGVVIAEKVLFPDRKASPPPVIRIEQPGPGMSAASLLMDELRFYAGKEQRTKEELDEATANTEFARFITSETTVKPWLENAVSMITLSDKVTAHAERGRIPVSAQTIDNTTYLPAAYLAEQFGGSASFDGSTVTVNVKGNTAVYTIGSAVMTLNGEEKEASNIATTVDGVAMIPADKAIIEPLFDARLTVEPAFCLVVLDEAKKKFVKEELEDVFDYTLYERPDEENFAADYKMAGQHPRVIATQADFDRVREDIKTNDRMKLWFEELKAKADQAIETETHAIFIAVEYSGDGRNLTQARKTKDYCLLMSMMYQMTHEQKYLDWLWDELKLVCDPEVFPMWNCPRSSLEGAEMGAGVAIAYDWLYHYWTPEQRAIIEKAVFDMGLECFRDGYYFRRAFSTAWQTVENNVNGVTNGCTGVMAMAMMDVNPEYCREMLNFVFQCIENGMIAYVPSGATLEGPSYWDYMTGYLVWTMASAVNCFGSDYGYFSENPFTELGAYYYTYMQSRQGVNNVADAGSENQYSQEVFYMAKMYEDKKLMRAKLNEMECNQTPVEPLDLLFYDPAFMGEAEELPLDLLYGDQGLLHNEYHTEDSIYASIHTGRNDSLHGNIDAGTFLIDALGVRWARELGHDNYSQADYWEIPMRGYLYKLSVQGQNVVGLNNLVEFGQQLYGGAQFTDLQSAGKGGFIVVDMAEAYGPRVKSAQRGMKLDTDRSQIVIQDELDLGGVNDVYWFMHTDASVTVVQGGKGLILKKNGKTMYMNLQTNLKGAKFTVEMPTPLPGSGVRPSNWSLGAAMRRIQIVVPEAKGKATISVRFIPMEDKDVPEDINDIEVAKMQPISEWKAEEGEYVPRPLLSGLTMDGEPMQEFSGRVNSYLREYPHDADQTKVPVIAATTDDDATIDIKQPENLDDEAIITVTSNKDTSKVRVYKLDLNLLPWTGVPEGRVAREVVALEASAEPTPGSNGVDKAFDNNASTYFYNGDDDGNNGTWFIADLGKIQHVDVISVRNHVGNTRRAFYDIQVSEDGKVWKTVFSDGSSGKTADFENIAIGDNHIRYIRFIGHGHSNGKQCSYNDIKFYGKD